MESKNELLSVGVLNEDKLFYVKLKETMTCKEIYEQHYSKKYAGSFSAFERKLYIWKSKLKRDAQILDVANLNFKCKPYRSTVQVNKNGDIVQAWIKNDNVENYVNDIINAIKENVKPINYNIKTTTVRRETMLEIPLFDMHFGINDYEYYSDTLDRIINIINKSSWDEIHVIIGQDLFHNDDFEGRTTKGTNITKVDMQKAWNDAKVFYYNILCNCIKQSENVFVHYSKGNHDKTVSWTFIQLLKALFPNLNYDDSLKPRKHIYWKGCFIGFGHCEYKKSKNDDLFKQFVLEYPIEYSKSTVKEIHTGHLHHEDGHDLGLMIRRLPTAGKTDDWSENEGFVGAHKRFMVFEYEPNFLSTINYV